VFEENALDDCFDDVLLACGTRCALWSRLIAGLGRIDYNWIVMRKRLGRPVLKVLDSKAMERIWRLVELIVHSQ
jgi:hypothetical protein